MQELETMCISSRLITTQKLLRDEGGAMDKEDTGKAAGGAGAGAGAGAH
jgi:hypothetical protein